MIIDRSLIQILKYNSKVSSDELYEFYLLLKELGVNYLEVDDSVLKVINFDIQGAVLRINTNTDIDILLKKNVNNIIINHNKCDEKYIEGLINFFKDFNYLSKRSMNIILEFNINSFDSDMYMLENMYKAYGRDFFNKYIKFIQLRTTRSFIPLAVSEYVRAIKNNYKVKLGLYPVNLYHSASSMAIDAFENAFDYVTTAFSGIDNLEGEAALEEVIMGLKVIHCYEFKNETRLLQKIKETYENLTGVIISPNKAIIGSDIFMCQSGIHIDGILKNPVNYEPYPPETVGLERAIVLGKHTGRAAVLNKLKECKIDFSKELIDKVVKKVREESIHSGISVDLNKLLSICKEVSENRI